jgi:phosphoribosylformylglycinamidine synthase
MGEACRALDIPVVSGNVSLYNETDGVAILPTPGIAVVGLVEGPAPDISGRFEAEGLEVALLGDAPGHLGGSAYLAVIHGLERGAPPPVDYERERALHDHVRSLVRSGTLRCAHDISDGGLAVAMGELCMGGIGGRFTVPDGSGATGVLFGEDHGRVIVAYDPANRDKVGGTVLGVTGGDRLVLGPIDVSIEALKGAWQPTFSTWAD